jgi:hypothetical protein
LSTKSGVEGVDGGRLIERHGGFAALNETDGLAHASAQIVVHHQAWFRADDWKLVILLKLFADEWADDQPARATQRFHGFAEGDSANDGSQLSRSAPGSFSSAIPMTIQRAGLLGSPTGSPRRRAIGGNNHPLMQAGAVGVNGHLRRAFRLARRN